MADCTVGFKRKLLDVVKSDQLFKDACDVGMIH